MTKKSKRTQAIFWLIIIGLLISMLIAFTPTLNGLFGGGTGTQADQQGEPALVVNGETVYSLEVAQIQQNPPFNLNFEGEVGDDLKLLLTDSLIRNQLAEQAASKMRVSDSDVRARVNQFREENNIAGASNDTQYLNLISQYGFNDATFRDYWREQLRFERYRDELTKDVSVSDAEVEAFYNLNQDNYKSEEKIKARQIVVSDRAKADEILAKAKAGEDFGTLAKDNSEDLADRNGALGAASGSTDPQPVGAAALPGTVSQAAFGLQGAGITDVISANEKFYIVNVEEFVPSVARPLEEVREEVAEAALESKKEGVLETTFEDLRVKAQVSIPKGSVLTLDDPTVAKVGDSEIKKSELVSVVYQSQQIQQSLQPGMEQIVTGIFKPSYLEQLIDREVAFQGSKQLPNTNFFGSKNQIAQQALQHVSKDAAITPEDVQKYYDENVATRFTIPPSAVANRINFTTQEAASAFRTTMLAGGELQATAEANGGIVADLGTVQPGTLPTELDTALFGTEAFETLPNSEENISDILVVQEPVEQPAEGEEAAADPATQEAKEVYVVLVGTRTESRVRPFEEVKATVEADVLNEKRNELQTTWLEDLKKTIPVENLLASVTPPPTEAAPTPTFETTPLPEGEVAPEGEADGSATPAPTDATETAPTGEATPSEGAEGTSTTEGETAPATEEAPTSEATPETEAPPATEGAAGEQATPEIETTPETETTNEAPAEDATTTETKTTGN
ncbi:MAG: peptidyl-prolyl cis-trans isomerase [Trueperaceae bacterium]